MRKKQVRSNPSNSDPPDNQAKRLSWTTAVVSLIELFAGGCVTVWVAVRSVNSLVADPDTGAVAVSLAAFGILLSLAIKLVTTLRFVVLDYLNLSEAIESSAFRKRILDDYLEKHPPRTAEDLEALFQQIQRSEQFRHDQMKSYYESVGKGDDNLLKSLWDWLINRRLGK